MSLRRSKIEIINDILTAIQDKGGRIKPTHLLYKSNLSHKKMMDYVRDLIGKGMMEEESRNGKYYIITDKGRRYVLEFKKIKEFSESFGL